MNQLSIDSWLSDWIAASALHPWVRPSELRGALGAGFSPLGLPLSFDKTEVGVFGEVARLGGRRLSPSQLGN